MAASCGHVMLRKAGHNMGKITQSPEGVHHHGGNTLSPAMAASGHERMGNSIRLIRSRAGGSDKAWHSAQVRARHADTFTYLWLDYAMIRSMSRRCRFRSLCLINSHAPCRQTFLRKNVTTQLPK